MSNSLWPHDLQHARVPCPSLSPRVCSNSCPLSPRYHPTILSSVEPFSFCLQSFPAPGSFPTSWLLCIKWPKDWSFSFSTSPSNEYSRLISFRIDWFDLLAVCLKSLLQHHVRKHQFFGKTHMDWQLMKTGRCLVIQMMTGLMKNDQQSKDTENTSYLVFTKS